MLADVKAGGVLTVLAFAGTGKTTCLRAYAQARPHLKILYLTASCAGSDGGGGTRRELRMSSARDIGGTEDSLYVGSLA